MLSNQNRLREEKDFLNVLKRGRAKTSEFLSVKFIKNNLDFCRIGFLTGAKIFKKAVIRNKIKRRLREAIRKQLPVGVTGYDMVLIARKGIENKKTGEIELLLKFLLNQ